MPCWSVFEYAAEETCLHDDLETADHVAASVAVDSDHMEQTFSSGPDQWYDLDKSARG